MSKIRVLGLDSDHHILPGKKTWVTVRPQVTFKGKQLHVPLSCAQYFVIHDIKVGYNSQKVSAEPIPADTFSLKVGDDVERMGQVFDLDVARVGMEIGFEVENISCYGVRFLASIIGDDVAGDR